MSFPMSGPSMALGRNMALPNHADERQGGQSSFSSMLTQAIQSANQLQLEADQAAQAFALGEIDDLHSVTIASAKADVALQLTLQIRNRVVDAYQEIMRMQV